jgi:hypothetical protein
VAYRVMVFSERLNSVRKGTSVAILKAKREQSHTSATTTCTNGMSSTSRSPTSLKDSRDWLAPRDPLVGFESVAFTRDREIRATPCVLVSVIAEWPQLRRARA